MTTLIGRRCKGSNVRSRAVLIIRMLAHAPRKFLNCHRQYVYELVLYKLQFSSFNKTLELRPLAQSHYYVKASPGPSKGGENIGSP